jgi:hypothetical protein
MAAQREHPLARARARPGSGPSWAGALPTRALAARAKPTWARAAFSLPRLGLKKPIASRLDNERPIKINGRAWFSADQKARRRSPPKP